MSCENDNIIIVEGIIKKWNNDREYVIEMMQDLQEKLRYVSRDSMEVINNHTGVPLSELKHIATFYNAFSLEPKGKYEIQVCTGTACHVKGAPRIIDAFERELGIKEGETTSDKLFSLEGVRCIGCCSLAPVINIGTDLYGDVQPSRVSKLLKKYE